MRLRRRGFLALAGAAAVGAAGCGPSGGGPLVRLASGEVGGFYHAFAGLLAAAAVRSGRVRIERVTTSGSQENLTLLADGQVDAALALSDSVGDSADRLLALGRVYENYLQLVVRSDSRIADVADLRGSRVNLGADGSGAALTGERILRVAGLDPAVDVAVSHRPLREAVAALAADESDALLWAGGVPTRVLEVPARMRLVDMGELAAPMRDRFGPVYDRVEIPADAYPGGAAVHTIGVANLLLVAAGLPDAAAAAIVELLVYQADSLVPTEAAGTQFLDGRSLISTAPIPLHPGAATVYRKWHG
ncbi:TAXI family TRAP transporter solute-binding subunit [Nocardia brasiliensis]|uniref:TAXI family TRAP transporter solute-binding subunit n=1 Tax=Nocardia brasiliensis TaxID=37326 RepID=A0A6G9XLE9_NOCBR|nr:TAXI family TRAP transporter solute-binding subunit [Nocardia brasiliensis]QIS01734.1 TAXI family TRAP transporter solute-binding subunit [Nocardia brasiliensis]